MADKSVGRPDAGPLLEMVDVRAGYIADAEVLRGVALTVPAGIIASIIGPTGAGKSTVLRLAFGFLAVREGSLRYAGETVTGWRPQAALRRGVAYVAQGRCNFPAMTVRENLDVGAFTRRDPALATDIAEMLDRFPILRQKQHEYAGNLSGGQQQLLETAMALVNRPRLLLIDEPTLGLSPKMFDEVFRAIQAVRDAGVTVLMVEQNAARALQISDYAFVMELGQKRIEGTGQAILNNASVREHYLGGNLHT